VIDATTLGFPFQSMKDLPAGDYYAQALINVYTQVHRSDGHTLWVHWDQWEGQQFNRSPGNLYSEVQKIHFDPAQATIFPLVMKQVVPPVQVPADTEYVKRIKIESPMLSKFWGHTTYLGATVLLPQGYADHPNERYPVVYIQGHFGLRAPYGFDEKQAKDPASRNALSASAAFSYAWVKSDIPKVIAISFQHPTPFFDDSYAVNSANNGPYGDAILQELIPYLEEHFRIIREPWARVLTGGSTGGWESLALQVYRPDFFGGTWTFFPDPVDFRRYQLVDIYQDDNAYSAPGFDFIRPERPMMRSAEGQVMVTMRQMSLLEEVLGTKGRSGQQFEAWEAVYGPVGADGYPKPLWDKLTGKIDRDVANYMREHGYDLSAYLQKNWPTLGPKLIGKLHLYCGDMDNYYLNTAVYKLEQFLESTKDPYYAGSFQYGRPMKGHGWTPYSSEQFVRLLYEAIEKNKPKQQ
jgi:enterochelin esterase-like enzyme